MDNNPFGYALVSKLTNDIIYRSRSESECKRYRLKYDLEDKFHVARDYSTKTENERKAVTNGS